MHLPYSLRSLLRYPLLARSSLTSVLGIVIMVLMACGAWSAPISWTNPNTGNWDDEANWSVGVPTFSDDPTIDNGGTVEVNNEIIPNSKDGKIIIIGRAASGTVVQEDGRLTAHSVLILGQQPGSRGDYAISGGTLSSVVGPGIFPPLPTGEILVGDAGLGTLDVGPNARVFTEGPLLIGGKDGGDGTVTTSGVISSSDTIVVGVLGNGKLNINGGTVTSGGVMLLGASDDGNSAGVGEVVQTAGIAIPLELEVGGAVEGPLGVEGTYRLSGGILQTNNPDDGNVEIGKAGLGLLIQTGGTINAAQGFRLGEEGDGTMEMSGGVLNMGELVNVADRGTGLFDQSGGTVNAGGWIEIGGRDFGPGRRADGTYRLTGGVLNAIGSHPATPGPIRVGFEGEGTFEVGPNGTANIAQNLVAGVTPTGNGTITTSGTLNIEGEIIIGRTGTGQMTVNGGVITSEKAFKIGQGTEELPNGDGTVTQNGGTINAGGWVELGSMVGATGAYNLAGGTLNSLGTEPNGDGDVNVGRDGKGTFTQTGGVLNVHGTLNVDDNSSYVLGGGELNMNGGGINLVEPTSSFNFTDGRLLDPGTFTGNLTQNGGTLSPGASAGTTSIEGDYTLNDGTLDIEIGGLVPGDQHDVLQATGELAINGGTLAVSLIDGFNPDAGNEFTILGFASASGGGFEFDLPPGEWDTSELLVNGTLLFVSGSGFVMGDMDCDGDIDFDDIDDFVLGLQDAAAYEALRGLPPTVKGDTDGDGDLDFDDIPGFVEIIGGGGLQSVPEPSAMWLLLTGMLVITGLRHGFPCRPWL